MDGDGSDFCLAVAAACVCERMDDHNGPHVCDCGGSWRGEINTPSFEIVELPGVARW